MLVLIHSPLIRPLTWRPSRDLLHARGFPVIVPSLAGVFEAGPLYYPKLAARVAETVRASAQRLRERLRRLTTDGWLPPWRLNPSTHG